MPRRLLQLCLLLGCLTLLGYSVYRAVNLSFVHDESLTYGIFAEDSGFRDTANNHFLNTAAMEWAHRWLGDREWHFRLANILAHVVYLGAGLLILRGLRGPAALLGFALLNLNPFLIEFFSLARGYGIASAFSLVSLCLLKEAWEHFGSAIGRVFLFLSSLAVALSVLGNYAWLNLHVAFLAVAIVWIAADYRASRVSAPGYFAFAMAFLLINGTSIFYVAKRMLYLREIGDLAGSDQGFIRGTLGSLIQLYLYNADRVPAGRDALLYAVIAIIAASGVWLVVRMIRERRVTFSGVLICILALASLAPVSEHLLFATMFPADRSALYYLPLTAVLIACAADEVTSKYLRPGLAVSAACYLMTAAMLIHFARTANLTHTLLWRYDTNTKEVMKEIEARVRQDKVEPPVSIGAFWPFEPTMNFYRSVGNYTWLERVTREPPAARLHDYVYGPIGMDLGEARKKYTIVRQYPLSNTELLVGPRIANKPTPGR